MKKAKTKEPVEVLHFPAVQQHDETGTKLEPEEAVIVREQKSAAETTLGGNKTTAGEIPVNVQTQHTATEIANALIAQCGGCRFFDNREGQNYLRKSMHPTAPKEAQDDINKLRVALLTSQNINILDAVSRPDGLEDADQVLMQIGKCHRLSDLHRFDAKDGVYVLPNSSCPPEYRTAMNPSGFYESRHKRDDTKIRDSVLFRAMRRQ